MYTRELHMLCVNTMKFYIRDLSIPGFCYPLRFLTVYQWFSNFSLCQNLEKKLMQTLLVPTRQYYESLGLGWKLRLSICNKSQLMLTLLVQVHTLRLISTGHQDSAQKSLFPQGFLCPSISLCLIFPHCLSCLRCLFHILSPFKGNR